MIGRIQPLKARYVGYTKSTENHGDEALYWIIRDMLEPEIVLAEGDEEYDLALLGGGTLINQSPWLIDHFECTLRKSRTGRGLVIGAGVGDTAFWGNHFDRWRPLLLQCDFIGVRGPHSLDSLRKNGIENAGCIGDPYLSLHSPVQRSRVPLRLGVNVGSTNNALWGTTDETLIDCIAAVCANLRSSGWTFSWFSVWSRDLPLLEALRNAVDPNSPPVLDVREKPLEAFSALAACDAFLGEKLHAIAMAAVAGVPFVALEYQPKVRDFAASLQMEEWMVSTADSNEFRLLEMMNRLVQKREQALRSMSDARDRLRIVQSNFLREIKQFYGLSAIPAGTPATS